MARYPGNPVPLLQIHTIDAEYVAPRLAACFWVEREGRCFLVETNTAHAAEKLWSARPQEQVDAVWVTHVHLDHAGGVGSILNRAPDVAVYAHPRAIRHLIDPSKLVKSASAVYGDAAFSRLYGTILPVPADRAHAIESDSTWEWQGTRWWVRHVRGHANHHLLLGCEETGDVFTGDAFGLSYPHWWDGFDGSLQRDRKKLTRVLWIPSTSPTDFDATEALAAVDWIEAQFHSGRVKRVWLTHFGMHDEIPSAAQAMRDWLGFSDSLERTLVALPAAVREAHALKELTQFGIERMERILVDEKLVSTGMAPLLAHRWAHDRVTQFDLKINAQGLAWAASKAEGAR